jgi:predicted nucleic acid-binding protein
MPGIVVDASVSAAWFLPDETTAFTEASLQATTLGEVCALALWLLDIGDLMLSAQRRKRITDTKRRELVAASSALRRGLPLATQDKALLAAMAAAGVDAPVLAE